MTPVRLFTAALLMVAAVAPVRADEVLDALEAARKAYQAGDYRGAKDSLETASELIGEKNAESYGALLPGALPGWTAEKVDVSSAGAPMLGASTARRQYKSGKGDRIEVQITGDSALLAPMAAMLASSQFGGFIGFIGKTTRIAGERAIVSKDGDVYIVVAGKFLVSVTGNGSASDKLAYAQAVDVAKLAKM